MLILGNVLIKEKCAYFGNGRELKLRGSLNEYEAIRRYFGGISVPYTFLVSIVGRYG